MICLGAFLLVCIIMIKAGKFIFNEPGVKKDGILGVFEDYVHEHLMIALPFFLVFVFHKVIFMVYYFKRYVQERVGSKEKEPLNKDKNSSTNLKVKV